MSDLPKQLCPGCNTVDMVRARIEAKESKTGLRYLKTPCGERDGETASRCGRKVGHGGRCCPGCDDCAEAGRMPLFGQLGLPFARPDPSGQASLFDLFKKG